MDSLAGALDGVVSDLKENCIFSIKSTVNTNSHDPQEQEDFVNDLVQKVEDLSCPGEPIACNGQGTCKKGRCVCYTGILQSSI